VIDEWGALSPHFSLSQRTKGESMKVLGGLTMFGGLDMQGNALSHVVLGDDSAGVQYAVPNRVAVVDGRLLFAIAYGQSVLWVPLLQERNTYIHQQDSASAVWTVPHGMNSAKVIVQVYNSDNQLVVPDSVEGIDADTVEITFAQATTGHAIIMIGNLDGMTKPDVAYEMEVDVATTEVTVNHMLGYAPIIRFITSDGFELLPSSVQHTTTNQTVLTFTNAVTGTVLCM
jgi:hypothetical protein